MAVRAQDRRRRRFPWWLLGLLALLLLALVIAVVVFAADDEEEEGAGQQGRATATATAQEGDGPVTDIAAIAGGGDASLVGRPVELTDVQVQSVVGDKTFWIGPSDNEQVFVFLEEEQDAAGVEGKVDVEAGESVSLTGTIEQMPQSPQDEFDVSEENSASVAQHQIYVRAESVEGAS